MLERKSLIFISLQVILLLFAGFCLWFRIFLPIAYYFVAISCAVLIILQILIKSDSRIAIFQIFILYLFLNVVYYLATNYHVIPFWDPNWDYAVVKTFDAENNIFVISGETVQLSVLQGYFPARILQSYSGWPILHSLCLFISRISGINAYYVAMVLPLLISVISFIFVYLIVEKFRVSLGFDSKLTIFAMLLFATSAEALFWQIQFVRQNLGTMMLFIMFFMLYESLTVTENSRKYWLLTILFGMGLVATHHFTSFIAVSFLILLFILQFIQRHIGGVRIDRSVLSKFGSFSRITLNVALLMSIFLFFWWNSYATQIWINIDQTLTRFIEVISGLRPFVVTPNPAFYSEVLTPILVTTFLTLRDVLLYLPAVFGLVILFFRKTKTTGELYVILSAIAFGLLVVVNNFSIRVETFRIFMLGLPIFVLLSATFLIRLKKKVVGVSGKLITILIVGVLIFTSFVGLWGHSFAPVHLYDTSVSFSEVGERNIDYMRVYDFVNNNLMISNFDALWVDDDAPLVSILSPEYYTKIIRIRPDYVETHSGTEIPLNELMFEFSDFNLYRYYVGKSSTITPELAAGLQNNLTIYFQTNFGIIYDDGQNRIWINENS